jgi:sarcosine oxidase, subunit alpha
MTDAGDRRFLFDGAPRTARAGGTLLDALAHPDLPILQRSIRYHRPRAPMCGVGYCTGCLVRVNDRPNVRACRYRPADGDRVATENAWPSPRFDLLGVLDALFPSGIDTLHGFRRPAFATGLYQRVVRRLAGYGRVPGAGPAPASEPVRRTADVAVVGGGASGRAAAARLAAGGRSVILLDRGTGVPDLAGVERLLRTTVTFLPPSPAEGRPFSLLGFDDDARGISVSAPSVIVATGAYDGSLFFAGNDRPGVMTGDAALALREPGGPPPFRHAIVFGAGERAETLLEALGDRVEGIVAPGAIPPSLVRRASELDVPLYPRCLVLRAEGRRRVRRLVVRSRGTGATSPLECDAVVLAHRRLPTPQLFFQAGATMHWRAGTGAYYPDVDPAGRTSVPGLFAAGAAAGYPPASARASGERAARAVLGLTADEPALERERQEGPHELDGYYRELLREPHRGKWVACPCEDVLVDELVEAHRRGYRGIEVVKRYSSVGTGLCQGRYCLPDAILLLSILEGRPPPEVGYVTQRPPVVPTPLAALAALDAPPETA